MIADQGKTLYRKRPNRPSYYASYVHKQISYARKIAKENSGEYWHDERSQKALVHDAEHAAGIFDELREIAADRNSTRGRGLRNSGVTPEIIFRAEEILFHLHTTMESE